MVIAQKSMTVQVVWRRRPIGLGTPMGVTVTIGACGTIWGCAVWVIDPLIRGMRVLASTRRLVCAACSFVQGLYRHSLSADRVSVAGPSAGRTGTTL